MDDDQDIRDKTPLFSIVMPSFNVEEYIAQSIGSVLTQSWPHPEFELIVVDDNSSDRTRDIVGEIAQSDKRVSLISNSRTKGPSGARNCGVDAAKGEWLCFLDSDDILAPNALSTRVDAINTYKECNFFSSDFLMWHPEDPDKSKRRTDTNEVWTSYFNPPGHEAPLIAINRPLDAFLDTVLAWTGGVALRKPFFQSMGGFDESLPRGEDDHLWWRAAATTRQMVLIREVTAYYRIRITGITKGTGSLSPYAPIVFSKLLRDPLFSSVREILEQKRAQHFYINCLHYRKHGKKFRAITSAFQYWLCYPTRIRSTKNLLACLLLRP
ncbi:glycosyltransferase family 2 protein [Marinobacter changyiensis]|uniref:glycosyltransferase family 2 protein n=1 Tax=Marinobacter changyiensis TaxID=2604091 RepID=UPI0012651F4E|nr:glycosyltransferase [Marinobacter changyiensis]